MLQLLSRSRRLQQHDDNDNDDDSDNDSDKGIMMMMMVSVTDMQSRLVLCGVQYMGHGEQHAWHACKQWL